MSDRQALRFQQTADTDHVSNNGLTAFLFELLCLKKEIEERYPEYFEYQSLRCVAPAGAHYQGANGKNIFFGQLCEWIGLACDLNLVSVNDRDELNAIDLMFTARTSALGHFFSISTHPDFQNECESARSILSFGDEESALAALTAIRQNLEANLNQRLLLASDLPAEILPKTIDRNGSTLTYFSGGSGTVPIVLINALGQGLRYWYRLINDLMPQHRIVIWESRNMDSASQPLRLADQVDDMEAILSHEGIASCHLVAWCTGPKSAIELFQRRPHSVRSMVFFNSAFKCFTTPKTLTTEYENNLEPLFQMLDSSPGAVRAVMKALRQSAADVEIPSAVTMDSKNLAVRVLSLINRDLLAEVVRPFESEASTLNYARQILDFYSCDIASKAAGVNIPVLLIGAEYDKIASPEISSSFAQLFPHARYVQLSGATHYCLYDQSHIVSGLIQDFLDHPDKSAGMNAPDANQMFALQPGS
jgi:pimeloyl-ACP methyl ester carboxylesterase